MIPKRLADANDFVRSASPFASEHSLRRVAKRIRQWKRWLNSRHPYRDVINALAQSKDIDTTKLGEYIACSAPLHLTDGWNYLSRAFDSASRGDRYSAYHLAYYAELRAAMSLLAAEGIGVFNRRHIALDANLLATDLVGRTTHQATWDFLSAWSSEHGKAIKLLDAITLESKSLPEWLEAVGVVEPSRQVVAKDWLRAWSVDLRILSDDRARRNEMSYRPTRIRAPAPPPVDPRLEMVDPLIDSWTVLEPVTASGAGVALDSSLLRQAITLAVTRGWSHYKTADEAVASLEGDMSTSAYDALSTENESAGAIFREASISNVRGRAAGPILARGLLMLRLASASTASLLAAAEVSKADLEFWWAPLGTDLGLWADPGDVEAFSDLWTDVDDAIYETRERMAVVPTGASVHAVSGILAREVSLTQFSRAPMWLLGFGG